MEVRFFLIIGVIWACWGCDVEENIKEEEKEARQHYNTTSPAVTYTPLTFEWLTSLAEPWQYVASQQSCEGVGSVDTVLLNPTDSVYRNYYRLGSVYAHILKAKFAQDSLLNKRYEQSFTNLRKKLSLPTLPNTTLLTLLQEFDQIFSIENEKNALALATYTGHWLTTLDLLCDCYAKKPSEELNELIAGQIVRFEQMQLDLSFFEDRPKFEFYDFLKGILRLSKHFEQVKLTHTAKTHTFAIPDTTIKNMSLVIKQVQNELLKP